MWGLINAIVVIWKLFIGVLSLGMLVVLIVGGYAMAKDIHELVTKEEIPTPECNPYENPDCHEEPVDGSDIYGPGEATLNGNPGYNHVAPYTRSDGTSVRGHLRSNPDGNPNNNLGGK